jgi:hypothetical protein
MFYFVAKFVFVAYATTTATASVDRTLSNPFC